MRVLVADVGRALGCGRTWSPAADDDRVVRVEDAQPPGEGTLAPVERAVEHLPSVRLDPEEARAASHGRPLGPAGILGPYAVLDPEDALVGIYRDDGPIARPEVVLPSR